MTKLEDAHVVFVDDDAQVCDTVRKTLTRAGMNVWCFVSAEHCLAYLAEERCDLLITDVKMPGKDGIELLQEARTCLPWLPVLVITGYGDVPMAVRALKCGAADFVEKPLDREAFLRTVRTLLARGAAHAALSDLALTRTETRVLHLILEGRNNREIAAALHRSPRTVEVHRGHLMRKMNANNIVDLLRRAADLGLFQGESYQPREPAVH
jgi:two-component system response regulator FixJ